jgi:hypothetical protein
MRFQRSSHCAGGVVVAAVLGLLAAGIDAPVARAEPPSQPAMQSLDEQVQEVKSDVLEIAAELSRLEEKLLYPSDTQITIFVALADREDFQLDSLEIQIDNEPVAHHIYSFKELEALQKGGVQRIYTGNISTGDHQMSVSAAGKKSGSRDVRESASFSIRKEVGPKLVELTLAGSNPGDPFIQLGGP